LSLPMLVPTALVDLATVEGELGLTPGNVPATDSAVARLIAAGSSAITAWLNRGLIWQQWTETNGQVNGPARIVLINNPIYPAVTASVLQVQLDLDPGIYEGIQTILVAGQDFYVEDCARGFLFRQETWPSTALNRMDIVQDENTDQVERTTQVIYLGGYITPVGIEQAVAWPGATTAVTGGTLMTPAAQLGQVWGCTSLSGTTGASQPSWPATPAQFSTVTDGSVTWTFLGWNTTVTTTPQARTLPYEIEQAAIETVTAWYRRRGNTTLTTAEKFGDASVTYANGQGGLPQSAVELLRPYRRVVM
jgi:hypothetical protein